MLLACHIQRRQKNEFEKCSCTFPLIRNLKIHSLQDNSICLFSIQTLSSIFTFYCIVFFRTSSLPIRDHSQGPCEDFSFQICPALIRRLPSRRLSVHKTTAFTSTQCTQSHFFSREGSVFSVFRNLTRPFTKLTGSAEILRAHAK